MADAEANAELSDDIALIRLIRQRLVYNSDCWRIENREGVGRSLVASRPLPAGTKVFTERPILAAAGGSTAVARAVLALDRESDDWRAACQLQSSAGAEEEGSGAWAVGLAAVNSHGAGGNLVDLKARDPTLHCLN